MKKIVLLLSLTLILFAVPGVAQQQEGDMELQVQGALTFSSAGGDSSESGSILGNWGYFITDRQQLGVTVGGFFVEDGDFTGVGGPFYRFNFGTSKVVPFLGASAETTFGSSGGVDGSFLVDLEGGVRWFLNRNIAFSTSARTSYYVDSDDVDFGDTVRIFFGFSYVWSR